MFRQLYGIAVTEEEFVPFMGTGEANFLGGVARKHGLPFDVDKAKVRGQAAATAACYEAQ